MRALADALQDAGGIHAPPNRTGRLRTLLEAELEHGARELAKTRSGYDGRPVTVAAGTHDGRLLGIAPVPPELRADPDKVNERGWLLTAALVGALVQASGNPDAELTAGAAHGALVLALPANDPDAAELFPLAFDEQVAPLDRIRTQALALPGHLLEDATADLRPPIGPGHPLRAAHAVARLGGHPADEDEADAHEEAVLALQGDADPAITRPHDDPDPQRRAARRIVQRLAGMGKWGGYHTEFSHLSRGFAGNDRRLAEEVGEKLLQAGILNEKQSVGQRHVFLNPRRARDVYALIEQGKLPPGLTL